MKPLSWYRELGDSRKRRQHGYFLVEGPRAVEQILAIAPLAIAELLIAEGVTGYTAIGRRPVRRLSERQFSSITTAKTPQGIAAVVRIPSISPEKQLPIKPGKRLLLLDEIQDPGNVGTLIRTAAALDYSGVILSPACADPLSPKAVQATAGSILSVWFCRTDRYLDHARSLKDRGFTLFAAALDGASVNDCHVDGPLVIMLGSEGSGLSASLLEIADARVAIPINRNKVESLNVAAAGAIVMHSLRIIENRRPAPTLNPQSGNIRSRKIVF
jgi:TrmH family RNA methyltransferase